MSAVPGRLRKLYIDVDGDIASPTWVEAGKIQGAQHNATRDVAEIQERDNQNTLVLPGHIQREITFDLSFRPSDSTVYQPIESAFENGTKIGVAMMSGNVATAGSRGWQGEVYVVGFSRPEGHTDSAVNVTVRPAADYVTAPAFVVVSA